MFMSLELSFPFPFSSSFPSPSPFFLAEEGGGHAGPLDPPLTQRKYYEMINNVIVSPIPAWKKHRAEALM